MVAFVAACGARSVCCVTSGAVVGSVIVLFDQREGGGFAAATEPEALPAAWRARRRVARKPRRTGRSSATAISATTSYTASAVSGQPWVALKVKGGNIILVSLDIDPAQGIVFTDKVEVASSPVFPVALDLDDRRFVMLTTSGINWNGEGGLTLWA